MIESSVVGNIESIVQFRNAYEDDDLYEQAYTIHNSN